MKNIVRKIFTLILTISLVASFTICTWAMVPFRTYTYDSYGNYFLSPHAFVPDGVYNFAAMDVYGTLNNPTDIYVDHNNYVFIADAGNNRILMLTPELGLHHEFRYFASAYNAEDSFSMPTGIFVDAYESLIYIADSRNQRIVIFDYYDFTVSHIINAPDPYTMPDGFIFEPFSMVVHPAGRIYVVSLTTNMGLIALTPDGRFDGFIGATRTSQTLMGFIQDLTQTRAQRARRRRNVPTEYNNITIDDQGFIFATTSAIAPWQQHNALLSGDTSTDNAPVKRLNSMGEDILRRNGFFPPAGDLMIGTEVSRFIDVAVTINGTYSILDAAQNRIFTYDNQGRLLYAFGGTGNQRGVFRSARSLAYQFDGTVLLVLDDAVGTITRFSRTAYGDAIAHAIDMQMRRRYVDAYDAWRVVLQMNSSLDIAYSGIGMIHMREGNFAYAMENFRIANDWDNYFRAAGEQRTQDGRIFLLLIPLGTIALLFALSKFFKYAKRTNTAYLTGRATLWQEFVYGFHIIFKPFDGFWDLKHEKRGGIRGAILILCLVLAGNVFSRLFSGYAVYQSNWRPVDFTLIIPILLPLVLWCVANWALTTLMDGKGTMLDIFITTCYGLMPMVLLTIPTAIFSNFLLASEIQFITALNSISLGWSFLLIFIGALVTNEYTFFKNLTTSILSIFGMAFMAFLGVLFINLMVNIWNFGNTIYAEIVFRM